MDPLSAFAIYPPMAGTFSTSPDPKASATRLQCTKVFMDDLMSATQGNRPQQERVTELTLWALKEIFPSLPAKVKDSVSLKKAMQGDRDWAQTKEILG